MTGNQRLPVAARCVIARACIAIGIACLVAQAVEVRAIHHSLVLAITGIVFPVLAALCGLYYLRQSRRRS